jgi:hypothetical protein
MYTLRRLPFLDRSSENYLNLIQVDPMPTETDLQDFVVRISPPQLSPFSTGGNCCKNVMRLSRPFCPSSISGIVDTYGVAREYLQAVELPHAVRIWREAGFTLDADMTKVFKKEDSAILAVMVKN